MLSTILKEINSFDLFREIIEIVVAPEHKEQEYRAKVEGAKTVYKIAKKQMEGGKK